MDCQLMVYTVIAILDSNPGTGFGASTANSLVLWRSVDTDAELNFNQPSIQTVSPHTQSKEEEVCQKSQ